MGFELELAEGSELTIDEVEFAASHNSKPMGQLFVHKSAKIHADARLNWNSASRGGNLVRHNWHIDLNEKVPTPSCNGRFHGQRMASRRTTICA